MKRKIKEVENWLKLQPGEFKDLTIITLVLVFCFMFAFESAREFGVVWWAYFALIFVLVAFSIAVHEFAHRWLAAKYLARVKSKLFLSGVIAALVLVFITSALTNGRFAFIFTALWAVSISSVYAYRPGRPFKHLGPYERAKIALAGPLANFGLAIVAKLLIPVFGSVAEKLMIINIWIAAVNLFPFFTLLPIIFWRMTPIISKEMAKGTPYVEGEYVFFGSRPLWAFTFIFVIVGGIALVYAGLLLSLVLAFLVAAGIFLAWHYWFEGARPKA